MSVDPDQVERLFQEACDLPEAQRDAFLAARCAGDAPLRREVESLLHHEQAAAAEFLAGPRDGGSPDALDEVGPRIGPYTVVRRIGEGGFGSVYLGEQETPIRRQVAIKVVKLGMDTRQIVRRFEAERQTLALMSHANIARAIDAGVTARGRPYFVMEYVPGPPITEYCDARRLGIRDRLALFLDVCAAVEHAHHKGVIHRDIKPSNILVDTVDGRPVVKVIDFGIAKALGSRADRTVTQAGHFVGTPDYVSPEQAAPGADVDTRSDIYSLGILLYRLLCGALPAGGGSTAAPGAATGAFSHPLPPSVRARSLPPVATGRAGEDPRALARRLRGDLDWITLKAIDPERARRYSSCSELAADLRRHLAGEPVSAGPPSTAYRLRKFVTRHRAAVAGAALAALLLAVGVPAITWQAIRATRAEAVAGDERDAARLETRRAAAVVEFLKSMLREASPQFGGSSALTVREALDRAARRLDDGALADQPEVEDAVRWTLGQTYVWLGARAAAADQFQWVVDHRGRTLSPDDPALGDALYWLGAELNASNRRDRAAQVLERAAEVYGAGGPGDFLPHHVDLGLTEIHLAEGRPDEALRTARRLMRALDEAEEGTLPAERAWAVFMLARAQHASGLEAESRASFERARALIDEAFEPVSLHRIIFIRIYIASVLLPARRYDEAVALAEPVLQAALEPYSPDHPEIMYLQSEYALALCAIGRARDAEPILRGLLETSERQWPPDAVRVLQARSLLGHALGMLGRDAEAEPFLVRAFEEMDARHPAHEVRDLALDRLIAYYARTGREDDAAAFRARR